MDKIAIHVRINNFCEMIEDFLLNSIKNKTREYKNKTNNEFKKDFDYNKTIVEDMLNKYSNDDLDKWKHYFKIDRLDRHKVAALTLLYLLKFNPIKSNQDLPISAILTEMCSLYIAYARLNNIEYLFEKDNYKRIHFSLVKICHNHRIYLEENVNIDIVNDECSKRFVEISSNLFFTIELFNKYVNISNNKIKELQMEIKLLSEN